MIYEDMPSNEMRLHYLDHPEVTPMGIKDFKYRTSYHRVDEDGRSRKISPQKKTKLQRDAQRDRERKRRVARVLASADLNGDAESLMGC